MIGTERQLVRDRLRQTGPSPGEPVLAPYAIQSLPEVITPYKHPQYANPTPSPIRGWGIKAKMFWGAINACRPPTQGEEGVLDMFRRPK